MNMPRLVRRVNVGERLGRGWGVAWVDFSRAQLVTMPIPLSTIVRLWLIAYWWLVAPLPRARRAANMRVALLEQENLQLRILYHAQEERALRHHDEIRDLTRALARREAVIAAICRETGLPVPPR